MSIPKLGSPTRWHGSRTTRSPGWTTCSHGAGADSGRAERLLRFTHRREIFPVIESAVLALPFAETAERLDREPVCWEPYRTLREAVEEDPRLVRDNPMFTETLQPAGLYPVPAAMARISCTETLAPVPAPRLGAHTEEVLSVDLGLTQARIGDLLERRVIAV